MQCLTKLKEDINNAVTEKEGECAILRRLLNFIEVEYTNMKTLVEQYCLENKELLKSNYSTKYGFNEDDLYFDCRFGEMLTHVRDTVNKDNRYFGKNKLMTCTTSYADIIHNSLVTYEKEKFSSILQRIAYEILDNYFKGEK